jgi:putative intracellular protease/amidase
MYAKNKKANPKVIPVAIVVIYDGFDILDISGPFAFLSAGGFNPVLAGLEKKSYKSGQGIEFVAQYSFTDKEIKKKLKGDYLLWIPGGFGSDFNNQFDKANPLLKWLSLAAPKAKLVSPVCTGALIAAAAGLLKDCHVTTHWAFKDSLELFKSKYKFTLDPGYPRYVYDKKYNVLTGGGISSGLDESLFLISILGGDDAAMGAQLINQYAPEPPFTAGTPATAPPPLLKNIEADLEPGRKQLNDRIMSFLKT